MNVFVSVCGYECIFKAILLYHFTTVKHDIITEPKNDLNEYSVCVSVKLCSCLQVYLFFNL